MGRRWDGIAVGRICLKDIQDCRENGSRNTYTWVVS